MKKVINPCMCDVYGGKARGFVEIVYEDGNLSLCGVVGPKSNGDCKGSAGQCTDAIRNGTPIDEWTREMVDKLCDIWDKWHLNDMNPYCEHQEELGWGEQAKEEIILYHYRMTKDAYTKRKEAENAALKALRNGKTFIPTEDQHFYASLPYSMDIYDPLPEGMTQYYEAKKPLYNGDCGPTEKKTRGWVRFDENEKGILCKPCPVCGYKYGTAWKKKEVPEDVIAWLFSLPDTKVQPAWV